MNKKSKRNKIATINKNKKKRDISVSLLYIKYNKKNYTFISTSTPLGNSSFIKASIVLDEDE